MKMEDWLKTLKKDIHGNYVFEISDSIRFTPELIDNADWDKLKEYMVKKLLDIYVGRMKLFLD